MNTQTQAPQQPEAFVGFSILRAGSGEAAQACLVTPYGGSIEGVRFEGDRLTLRVSQTEVVLQPLPADIQELIRSRPGQVLLVSVDVLSRIRQSTPMGGLLTH